MKKCDRLTDKKLKKKLDEVLGDKSPDAYYYGFRDGVVWLYEELGQQTSQEMNTKSAKKPTTKN